MGLLDGMLGGLVGAGINQVLTGVLQQHGGLEGVVRQFEQKGLGNIVQSWVGKGANLPISPDQLQKVLGSDLVAQLAGKLNINPQDLLGKLAEVLPQHVDKLTPDGVIPKG